MFIRTERLFLRPAFSEDWREVYRGLNDEVVAGMLTSAPWPYGEQDARDFCMRQDQRGAFAFLVTLPGRFGAPVIGAMGIEKKDGPHELGYWLARPYWGCGYATEAARAILNTARALGVKRVVAGHFVENPASGRVLRKAGFRETGEIVLAPSAARGGEILPARRYAINLVQAEGEMEHMDAAA